MSHKYYAPGTFRAHTGARADAIQDEMRRIESAFDTLPPPDSLSKLNAPLVAAGGTANALTITNVTPLTEYATGQKIAFIALLTNSGEATVDVDDLGPRPLLRTNGAALGAGDLLPGRIYEAVYNGSEFQIIGTQVDLTAGDFGVYLSLAEGNAQLTTDDADLCSQAADQAVLARNEAVAAVATLHGPDIQTFTTSGTWTKPSFAVRALVEVWGAGGGGGSGRRGAEGSNRYGGSGGGGGAYACKWFMPADLAATEAVAIGAGGSGGSSITTDSTNGNAGGTGGLSSFGVTKVRAQGGGGGAGGSESAGLGGNGGGIIEIGEGSSMSNGGAAVFGGGGGGGTIAGGGSIDGGGSVMGGGGGGGGRGRPDSNNNLTGSTGGSQFQASGGGGAASTSGAAFQGGGGGGQSNLGGSPGGAGGIAGGGGGSGASPNGQPTNNGGGGGAGLVRVTTWRSEQ